MPQERLRRRYAPRGRESSCVAAVASAMEARLEAVHAFAELSKSIDGWF
jgi:hypothetical protein